MTKNGMLDPVAGVEKSLVQDAFNKSVNPPTIDDVAMLCHEINRAWCIFCGDNSQPSWQEAPDWQKSSCIDGITYHLSNPTTTPRDSHMNWLKTKQAEGWKWGMIKAPERKEHPCFCSFDSLPWYQQVKDKLFFSIVKAVQPYMGQMEATAGDRAMGRTFNPSFDWRIDLMKEKYSELYGLIERFAKEQTANPITNDDFARMQVARNKALSITALEDSKMRAVEMVTR